MEDSEMRVLLTTWGSRGDVEPLVGLAVALREFGAEARVCAPPDDEFAQLLERVGVPLVPLGPTVRSVVAGTKPPTADDAARLASELVAAGFDTLRAAAEGCDALLANGMMAAAGARGAAERLGVPYVYACYHTRGLPPRHFPPWAGEPSPQDEADRGHWEQGQRATDMYCAALNSHRVAIGLQPVDDFRDYVYTGRPWLAADATLCPSSGRTDIDVVQTGAWVLPDDRPLPEGLVAFLNAGTPPVYVGFGSMTPALLEGHRPGGCRGQPRAGPSSPARPRLGRPGPCRRRRRLFPRRRSQPAGTVPPSGRHRAPRWCGNRDDGDPGRCAPGGGTPDRGPAVLGRPRGRIGHRCGTWGPDADRRFPVRRPHHRSGLPHTNTSQGRGRHYGIRTNGASVAARLLLDAVAAEEL